MLFSRMSITATVPILMMSYKSLPRRPLRHERDQPSPKERHINILRPLFRFGASRLGSTLVPGAWPSANVNNRASSSAHCEIEMV